MKIGKALDQQRTATGLVLRSPGHPHNAYRTSGVQTDMAVSTRIENGNVCHIKLKKIGTDVVLL